MKKVVVLCLALFALSAGALAQEFTAEQWEQETAPSILETNPETLFPGSLSIPLPVDARLVQDCREYFADDLPDLSPSDAADFDRSVVCLYMATPSDEAVFGAIMQSLSQEGFQNESGTYVQSAMGIFCNRTHSLVTALKAAFVPRSLYLERDGETVEVEIEGGGTLAHPTMMISVTEEPCERYRLAEGYSETPAPDGYANFETPNFVDPTPEVITKNGLAVQLRPADRLVEHCAQYYREEIGSNLPADAIPEEFARWNKLRDCIYVPKGQLAEASAYYLDQIRAAGLTRTPQHAQPRPDADERFPSIIAGHYQWRGGVALCGELGSAYLDAMARHGSGVLLDVITGEYWATLDDSGGRRNKLDQAEFPHEIITIGLFGEISACR